MPSRVVVLTRRHEDNAELARVVRERGARVLELPCVRVEPLGDVRELAAAVTGLSAADVLVLTSRAGADAVASVIDPRRVACGVAAVGDATARHAADLGMTVRFVASRADSATLAQELPLPDGTVVLARSDLADRAVPDALAARGATVRDVVAYRTVAEVSGDPTELVSALAAADVTIVVASPSAVDALSAAIGPASLRRAVFVAIGTRTARQVHDRVGVAPIVAGGTDTASIARAISPVREEVAS